MEEHEIVAAVIGVLSTLGLSAAVRRKRTGRWLPRLGRARLRVSTYLSLRAGAPDDKHDHKDDLEPGP